MVCVRVCVWVGGSAPEWLHSLPHPFINACQQLRACRHGDGFLAFCHEALLRNSKATPLRPSRLLSTFVPSDPVMPPAHLGSHACAWVTGPFFSLSLLSCAALVQASVHSFAVCVASATAVVILLAGYESIVA